MSKATKRKHVTREVLDDYVTPDEKQIIVKIIGSRGNNLHEAETPSGNNFLISMPSKFRKNVWIKRGDFVIVDPIKEGNKVCGEIAHILYPQQVKYLKKEGLWPEKFLESSQFEQNGQHDEPIVNDNAGYHEYVVKEYQESGSESENETDDDLFVNPNHIHSLVIHSDSSDEESSDNEHNDDERNEEDCAEVASNVAIKTIIDNNNTN